MDVVSIQIIMGLVATKSFRLSYPSEVHYMVA